MSICLLIGITFLAACAVSFPMYRTAAFDRMLQDEFDQAYSSSGEWPALSHLEYTARQDPDGGKIQGIEQFVRGLHSRLGVTEYDIITYYVTARLVAYSEQERDDVSELPLRISFLSNMEEHITMLKGELYSESGISEDGYVEVVISQACLVNSALLLGETVEFPGVFGPDGNPVRIRIVGVFGEEDDKELYWQVDPDSLTNNCMIREEVFREYFTGERAEKATLVCTYFPIWEYEGLKAADVAGLYHEIKYQEEQGSYKSIFSEIPYLAVLESYMRKETRINATLFILQVPIWVLLGAFLFMISSQMYDIERNEISVIKSRGSSGLQIYRLYLYQSIFLTVTGAIVGLPLGRLFAKALGATESFLEFNVQRSLNVNYTPDTFLYLLAVMCGSVLMITLPAVKHSRLSIVNLKQQKASWKWSWWEKCFLDVILLALSIAGYQLCLQMEPLIVENALKGEAATPLLYIDSSLFIIGAGLLLVRLQPYLIRLIYVIGKRFWGPASYISFMENQKNGRKQQFIMLFLILSISLGMYHATAARTILQNAKENVEYIDGADLIVKEVWRNNASISYEGVAAKLEYYDPGAEKYYSLPGAVSYTKVIYDSEGVISGGEGKGEAVTLMGLHTKQFGENTSISARLLEKPYYEYLNELAVSPTGILVSSNFRDLLGYEKGDKVRFSNRDLKSANCEIVDFVDYWPGYVTSVTELNPDGSASTQPQYLVVANIAFLTKNWGTVPYETWVTMDEVDTAAFNRWAAEQDVRLEKYVDRDSDLKAVEEDPLLQGTNGILTMGFLVTLLLFATGYLIYWILSIRSREMMFGILRAEGLHRGEIFHLLINEQIFCGGFAVLAGSMIGNLSSKMFVPILQTSYAATNQVLPMHLVSSDQDMMRLYAVIGTVLVLCLAILVFLVQKLDVAKALKLGEE